MELKELRDVINSLKLSDFCYLNDEEISDNISYMIKDLPNSEELSNFSPYDLQKVGEMVGKIMSLIEKYSKRDVGYKTRHEVIKNIPPRYKVLERRKVMNSNISKYLIKVSKIAEERGNEELSEKSLVLAERSLKEDIEREEVKELFSEVEKLGLSKEAQRTMWQGMKDFFTGGPSKGMQKNVLEQTKQKLKQNRDTYNKLYYIKDLINKDSYDTGKVSQLINSVSDENVKERLSQFVNYISEIEQEFSDKMDQLSQEAGQMMEQKENEIVNYQRQEEQEEQEKQVQEEQEEQAETEQDSVEQEQKTTSLKPYNVKTRQQLEQEQIQKQQRAKQIEYLKEKQGLTQDLKKIFDGIENDENLSVGEKINEIKQQISDYKNKYKNVPNFVKMINQLENQYIDQIQYPYARGASNKTKLYKISKTNFDIMLEQLPTPQSGILDILTPYINDEYISYNDINADYLKRVLGNHRYFIALKHHKSIPDDIEDLNALKQYFYEKWNTEWEEMTNEQAKEFAKELHLVENLKLPRYGDLRGQ